MASTAHTDADAVRTEVERLLDVARFGVGSFSSRHRDELASSTAADADMIRARVLITWLLVNGLITSAEPEAFVDWFRVDLPEPFAGDVAAKLQEAVARRARFDAMAATAVPAGQDGDTVTELLRKVWDTAKATERSSLSEAVIEGHRDRVLAEVRVALIGRR